MEVEEEERERREELVRILTKIQDTLNDRAFVEGLQRSLDRGGSGLFGGLRDAIFQAVINALVAQALASIGKLVVQLDNCPGNREIQHRNVLGLGRSAHSPKDRQLLNDLLSGNAGNGASDMVSQTAKKMEMETATLVML